MHKFHAVGPKHPKDDSVQYQAQEMYGRRDTDTEHQRLLAQWRASASRAEVAGMLRALLGKFRHRAVDEKFSPVGRTTLDEIEATTTFDSSSSSDATQAGVAEQDVG